MRTPAEIETFLRVMRQQGCPEMQFPDLLLKVRVNPKDIRPVGETMFPEPAAEPEPAQPKSYDPGKPPRFPRELVGQVSSSEDDIENDLGEISDEDAENFGIQVAQAVRDRHAGKAAR